MSKLQVQTHTAAPGSHPEKKAFTLVEMLVASFISLLLITGLLSSFAQHRRTYSQKALEQELQQNLRSALSQIHRDLRMSNSGLVMGTGFMGDWFSSLSGISSFPHVVEGGDGRDRLITVGYTGEPIGRLASGIAFGSMTCTLQANPELDLPYTPSVGDVLVLGSLEAVKVTSVAGNRIEFTTDPGEGIGGTHLSYPSGMEVYELAVVEYSLGTEEGVIGLKREDSRFTYGTEADKFVALHIESFDITETGDQITVELVGRTKAPVAGYSLEEDGYPRYTLSGRHTKRNPEPKLSVSSWDKEILMASVSGSATPTPRPTSVPVDPTPTPIPQPTATPVPQATATPAPQPTATPVPQPTATPVPQPTATPVPEPTPTPTSRPHAKQYGRCWCKGTPESVNHPK